MSSADMFAAHCAACLEKSLQDTSRRLSVDSTASVESSSSSLGPDEAPMEIAAAACSNDANDASLQVCGVKLREGSKVSWCLRLAGDLQRMLTIPMTFYIPCVCLCAPVCIVSIPLLVPSLLSSELSRIVRQLGTRGGVGQRLPPRRSEPGHSIKD